MQVKVKINIILEQAMKVQKGVEVSTLSLTSALDGVGWSTPRPCLFTPWKDPVSIV